METIKSNYIKYKFVFENNIKHSSYTYQRIFRSIYGYKQNVSKNNNKKYVYFRKGVLSNMPLIRPGKNVVVIPLKLEHKLIDFFNTGVNPTHNWKEKGSWSVDYKIDVIDIDINNIIKATEDFLKEYLIVSHDGSLKKIIDEVDYAVVNNISNIDYLDNDINYILDIDWFNKSKEHSEILSSFYNNILLLKNKE